MLASLYQNDFLYYDFIVLFALMVCFLSMPSILHVARQRLLFDDAGQFRKQHDHGIPRIGGVAVFVSFTITSLLFSGTDSSLPTNYVLTACIILFAVGLKDDLSGVNPTTKFAAQTVVAGILAILGNIRLTSLYGIFGIYDLPFVSSVLFSMVVIIFMINAFNLIDGIDGLAGTLSILVNTTFAFLFIYMGRPGLAVVSLSMVGAVIGFLRYNYTPAKIFMGDTGSLLLGLISVVLAIKFIELNKFTVEGSLHVNASPALAVAILIIPIFDTIRVFTLRIFKRISPFTADNNHIHHRLLRLGLNHTQVTLVLAAVNILFIAFGLSFRNYSNFFLLMIFLMICLALNWVITYLVRSRERESHGLRNFIS
ncbi:MAG: MraY family glycosyltransferase [Sphingobacteriaceae bacterium]